MSSSVFIHLLQPPPPPLPALSPHTAAAACQKVPPEPGNVSWGGIGVPGIELVVQTGREERRVRVPGKIEEKRQITLLRDLL